MCFCQWMVDFVDESVDDRKRPQFSLLSILLTVTAFAVLFGSWRLFGIQAPFAIAALAYIIWGILRTKGP